MLLPVEVADVPVNPQSARAPARIEMHPDPQEARAFLDREFDGRAGLVEEFPLLAGPANAARQVAARDARGIAAFAAYRALVLRTPAGPIRAAGIGLVTTRRDCRGRGLASQLVAHCTDDAAAAGRRSRSCSAPSASSTRGSASSPWAASA